MTLWIDSHTYELVAVDDISGTPAEHTSARYTWLPRTRRNLALLTGTVPAGFSRTN